VLCSVVRGVLLVAPPVVRHLVLLMRVVCVHHRGSLVQLVLGRGGSRSRPVRKVVEENGYSEVKKEDVTGRGNGRGTRSRDSEEVVL